MKTFLSQKSEQGYDDDYTYKVEHSRPKRLWPKYPFVPYWPAMSLPGMYQMKLEYNLYKKENFLSKTALIVFFSML